MCGIAGIILPRPRPDLPRLVAQMTQRLYHRGPDDGGLVAFDAAGAPHAALLGAPHQRLVLPDVAASAVLGVRRLAILDRSTLGRQPMSDPAGRAWAVHNGEIYNYLELREALRRGGATFRGGSDTEVLLAAWRAWRERCYTRFDGMWADAIYEPPLRRLTLSRDPMGIKPLHTLEWEGGLAFASEIAPLLELPGIPKRVHTPRLIEFLCEGWTDHTDDTLFEGVRSLPAGARLTVEAADSDDLRTRLDQDWPADVDLSPGDADDEFEDDAGDDSEEVLNGPNGASRHAPLTLRRRLEHSIRIHLRSDVPIGCCLSGGVDSSAIVALLGRLLNDPARRDAAPRHLFTAILPGDPLDESRWAGMVAAASPGMTWHRVLPTAARMIEQLDRLIRSQELPFASPSIYMQWEVMQAASDADVRVLLDGQGGDELWCGYPGHLPPYAAWLLRKGRFSEAAAIAQVAAAAAHLPGGTGNDRFWFHAAAHLLPAELRARLRRRRWRSQARWMNPDLLHGAESVATASPEYPSEGSSSGSPSSVPPGTMPFGEGEFGKFWWSVLRCDSLPALLRFEDRNSMAFSMEARVPMLGRGLIRHALATPARVKLAGGRSKALLRDAMHGVVPDAILDRRDKIGFSAPTAAWLRGPLADWRQQILTSSAFRQRGWFAPEAVRQLADRLARGDDAAALPLWRVLIAECWARQFGL